MHPWSNLPNAKLIDQLLADLIANPEIFYESYSATMPVKKSILHNKDPLGPLLAAHHMMKVASRREAWDESNKAVVKAAPWNGDRPGRRAAPAADAAAAAVFALVAYDDSGKYLDLSYEELMVWATLTEEPATILLLTYSWVQEQRIIKN
jgi:hypothetical protein